MEEQLEIQAAKTNFRHQMSFQALLMAIEKASPEIHAEYKKNMSELQPKINEYLENLDNDYKSRQNA